MSFELGGEKSKSKANETINTSIDEEGLEYLLKTTLEENEGLASVFSAEQQSGIYDSSTASQTAGNLIARTAGEVAARNVTVEKTGSSKSGKGGGKIGTVLCTHYMREGLLDSQLHAIAAKHASDILSRAHLRGYHFWACSVVEMLRLGGFRARVLHAIFFPITCAWVNYLAGKRDSIFGAFTYWVMRPMCWLIGVTIARKEQDWYRLYRTRESGAN